MSIKKLLIGSTASLLLASGFITTSASASETPVENNLSKESSKGIKLPSDMKTGDIHEEIVDVSGDEDITYTVTKTDENVPRSLSNSVSIMADQVSGPQTVPVSGTASFKVEADYGVSRVSFYLTTRSGLIDTVYSPDYFFLSAVNSDTLELVNGRLAIYTVRTAFEFAWFTGPSWTAGIRARIVSAGTSQNINTLYTEAF